MCDKSTPQGRPCKAILWDQAMSEQVRDMLENRHNTHLYWDEPRAACGPMGEDLTSHTRLTATVNDCINIQRLANSMRGKTYQGNDDKLLEDFMTNHWAKVVKNKNPMEDW